MSTGDRKPFQVQGVARASAYVCSFIAILSAIKSQFLFVSFRFVSIHMAFGHCFGTSKVILQKVQHI